MPGKTNGKGGNFYRPDCGSGGGKGAKMTRNIASSSPQDSTGESVYSSREQQERAIRERHRKEVKLESYLADDENFPSFKAQLIKLGLQLRDIPADGNCLFRALGDQLEGHCRNHFKHRADVVAFMRSHRIDFEPFVEDDVSFDDHMRNLQKLSTHAGNDAIVAFAKLHGINIVIHQLNGKPLLICGPANPSSLTRQLHIAYHNGDHYSSVRQLNDNTESPAHIRLQDSGPKEQPMNNNQIGVVSAHRGLEDIENEVVMATNCTDVNRVRQVLLECDYDVDASIADLLQQMELNDDTTSLATTTTDSGMWTNDPDSNSSSPNSSSGRSSALKSHGSGSVNGKGHKVHFREDSFGGSSGYGSLSSNKGAGARPKIIQMSAKKMKEFKKAEKKRRAEERHRQKILSVSNPPGYPAMYVPQASDVRNVGVVDQRYPHPHVITHSGRLTSI